MNKDQRTIYKKIENPDRNCMVRIFPLQEYWHSPAMNWSCEGPSVEGQIMSVAYVYIVSKVRQRMITLSLFHIGIHFSIYIFINLMNFFGNYQEWSYDYEHWEDLIWSNK